MSDIRQQIQLLKQIRLVDDRILALRRQLAARQADIERRSMEANLAADSLARESARLEELKRRHREAELEVKTCRDAKRHFEKQLHDVKTNVEYQALLKSIATMERKIDEWEDVILESMEGEEELEKRVKSLEKDLAEKKKAVGELQSAFEAEKASAEKEIDACLRERDGYLEVLTGQVRSKYMRLMEAKGETAVVAVEQGSCGGCHYALPPQRVAEIRKGERLILCEGCGRILVWAEDTGN